MTPINCPFCGGATICDPLPTGYHQVFCRSVITCGAAGSPRPTSDEAIAMWNRRVGQHVQATEPALSWRCLPPAAQELSEPAAYMLPSHLAEFQRKEVCHEACSVSFTNVDTRERSVPLFTADQLRAAYARGVDAPEQTRKEP